MGREDEVGNKVVVKFLCFEEPIYTIAFWNKFDRFCKIVEEPKKNIQF